MTDHPITPPPELIQEWWEGDNGALDEFDEVVKQAARWGADQELEGCCKWLRQFKPQGDALSARLRTHRRPKPKSLAEQKQAILAEIDELLAQMNNAGALAVAEPIRRALERLQELEDG